MTFYSVNIEVIKVKFLVASYFLNESILFSNEKCHVVKQYVFIHSSKISLCYTSVKKTTGNLRRCEMPCGLMATAKANKYFPSRRRTEFEIALRENNNYKIPLMTCKTTFMTTQHYIYH